MSLAITLLETLNETLAAAIVIIATSLLLYNLSRNQRNRVIRTSSILLASVTAAYLADVFLTLQPGPQIFEAGLRLQWIGIAFLPTALLHLSDALLATTGLPSRGRRRRIIRILYLISSTFLVMATSTELLIQLINTSGRLSIQAGPMFPLFVAYFIFVTVIAFINIERARRRCLTRSTKRRMAYLQIGILMPPVGIFPYSVLLPPGDEYSLMGLVLVNLTNLFVVLMLIFLSYPLSFFGSRIPDRVVKTELLSFLLYGPGTGLLALGVITFMTPTTRILGIQGEDFMPFAVVAVILLWQWSIALALPWLEKRLIFPDDDDDQISKLQDLDERLLTRTDTDQLIEGALAATCDYLQVSKAFAASIIEGDYDVIKSIGNRAINSEHLTEQNQALSQLIQNMPEDGGIAAQRWGDYWIILLYSRRGESNGNSSSPLIGLMGIEATSDELDLTTDEQEKLRSYARRISQTLDDMMLQEEIFAALEGLLPQISISRLRDEELEYLPGRRPQFKTALPDRDETIEQVRAALRHYWGGPGITRSRLINLKIVQNVLEENDHNAANALRAVLVEAIESQRPQGERKYPNPEWTIYNILQLRFIERMKVRDVAMRLSMSESDLYRKQRVAIEALADSLLEMEASQTD